MNSELKSLLEEVDALRKHIVAFLWEDASLYGLIPEGSKLEETSCKALSALCKLKKELSNTEDAK